MGVLDMIKSNSLRGLFLNQNKIILDIMIKLGGKCYLFEKAKLIDLIICNNMVNSANEEYTKTELNNVISDMIECNILKKISIKRVEYIYFSTRTIKELLGVNSNVSLPNSLGIYNAWQHKYDFISYVASKFNMNTYDFICINCKANTLFDISSSKIEFLNAYFGCDVKKEVYTLYSLGCHYLWDIKGKYAFYLDVYVDNAQELIKTLNTKIKKCEDSIKLLVSQRADKEYMLVPKENKILYIGVPKELYNYLNNYPISSNYITIKFIKL